MGQNQIWSLLLVLCTGGPSGILHAQGKNYYPSYQQPAKEETPLPYSFHYMTDDGQGNTMDRHEISDPYGSVKGSYGYWNSDGIYRTVDYVAGADGFKAKIKTNEPGTANANPADVYITALNPPPYRPPKMMNPKYPETKRPSPPLPQNENYQIVSKGMAANYLPPPPEMKYPQAPSNGQNYPPRPRSSNYASPEPLPPSQPLAEAPKYPSSQQGSTYVPPTKEKMYPAPPKETRYPAPPKATMYPAPPKATMYPTPPEAMYKQQSKEPMYPTPPEAMYKQQSKEPMYPTPPKATMYPTPPKATVYPTPPKAAMYPTPPKAMYQLPPKGSVYPSSTKGSPYQPVSKMSISPPPSKGSMYRPPPKSMYVPSAKAVTYPPASDMPMYLPQSKIHMYPPPPMPPKNSPPPKMLPYQPSKNPPTPKSSLHLSPKPLMYPPPPELMMYPLPPEMSMYPPLPPTYNSKPLPLKTEMYDPYVSPQQYEYPPLPTPESTAEKSMPNLLSQLKSMDLYPEFPAHSPPENSNRHQSPSEKLPQKQRTYDHSSSSLSSPTPQPYSPSTTASPEKLEVKDPEDKEPRYPDPEYKYPLQPRVLPGELEEINIQKQEKANGDDIHKSKKVLERKEENAALEMIAKAPEFGYRLKAPGKRPELSATTETVPEYVLEGVDIPDELWGWTQ